MSRSHRCRGEGTKVEITYARLSSVVRTRDHVRPKHGAAVRHADVGLVIGSEDPEGLVGQLPSGFAANWHPPGLMLGGESRAGLEKAHGIQLPTAEDPAQQATGKVAIFGERQ
jgi:hypothetical protein